MSKSYGEREGENNKKYRQNITIFSITVKETMSCGFDFGSVNTTSTSCALKRMLKITSGVFYCILFKNSAKKAI